MSEIKLVKKKILKSKKLDKPITIWVTQDTYEGWKGLSDRGNNVAESCRPYIQKVVDKLLDLEDEEYNA